MEVGDRYTEERENGKKAPPAERTGGADLANLPLVDTMHHALQAWCIFAEFVLTRRDNEDRKDNIKSAYRTV